MCIALSTGAIKPLYHICYGMGPCRQGDPRTAVFVIKILLEERQKATGLTKTNLNQRCSEQAIVFRTS